MSIDLNLINADNLKPRGEVRIEDLRAEPYPDRQRVKITLALTPFRERPSLHIALHDAAGRCLAEAHVIDAMTFTLALTMHLRGIEQPAGEFSARAILYYEDIAAPQDRRVTPFTIALPDN